MTISLNLDGAFSSKEALHEMIVHRKVCFDHDPFYVKDAAGNIVQIGFQLNLYAAFQDPQHLPLGDDSEHREILGELHRLCRLFFQSLDLLKPCEHPDPPAHRVVFSPERRNRAEVLLQIPIFDRAHFGAKSGRHVQELLATAECLLKQLGARRGCWEEQKTQSATAEESCEGHVAAAEAARSSGV
jgi:hypothetical protein